MYIIQSFSLWKVANDYPQLGKTLQAWVNMVAYADWSCVEEVLVACPKTCINKEKATFIISENGSSISVRIHYEAKIALIEQIQFRVGFEWKVIKSYITQFEKPNRQINYIWTDADYEEAKHALFFGWLSESFSVDELETYAELIEAYEQTKWDLNKPSFCDDLKFFMWQKEKSFEDLSTLLGSRQDAFGVLNDDIHPKISAVWKISKNWGFPFLKNHLLYQIAEKKKM